MSFTIGIVGLPNAGKSTLFKSLTQKNVEIASYPFTTIEPNVGIVSVPDERLDKIASLLKIEKKTPTFIKFIDIAGLVKGAHKGEGLGNQFLSHIRECDAILEIIRDFQENNVEHVEKTIDPKRDIEIIATELLMKDLETVERAIVKYEKEKKTRKKEVLKKLDLLEKIRGNINNGKPIRELSLSGEEEEMIKEYNFLTQKPIVYLLNISDGKSEGKNDFLKINIKKEEDILDLSENEKKDLGVYSELDKLILECYNVLNLITFYTVVGLKEARAWTLPRGETIMEAAEKVHSDFKEKFKRGEVINWKKLLEAESIQKARESGWVKIVGKDYIVEDGDIIEFKI